MYLEMLFDVHKMLIFQGIEFYLDIFKYKSIS